MTEDRSRYEGLADPELLVLSKRSPEAFGIFYERHAEALLRFFARRTLDPESAAELTAETFAQAFRSRHRFTDQGRGGAGWLYGVARHELSHFYRRGAVDRRARRKLGMPEREVSDDDYERIEEMIDLAEVRRSVASSFDSLPAGQREAVELRVLEDRSYEEVARELHCSEGTARARVSRGLRKLSTLLESERESVAVVEEVR